MRRGIFLVAACCYLALTTVWSFLQRFIERRLADPGQVIAAPSLRERLTGGGLGRAPAARTPPS